MGTISKFVLAVIVSAIAWVFFSVIVHIFPSTQYLFENYFIAAGMLYISIGMGISIPIGIVVTIVLGIILSDIWYAPVIQYIILELFIKLALAISVFAGAGIVMNKLDKKSSEPVANPEPKADHVEMEDHHDGPEGYEDMSDSELDSKINIWHSMRLKNEIKEIYNKHADVLNPPILTAENYEFVSTYYLMTIIDTLDYDINSLNYKVKPWVKERLNADLAVLYCGISYYGYLKDYAESKYYDDSIISTIDKSRDIFYNLYIDDENQNIVKFRRNILLEAIMHTSKQAMHTTLSGEIEALVGEYVIWMDYHGYTKDAICLSLFEWERDVVPIAYKFIDNMQEFITAREETNPDD